MAQVMVDIIWASIACEITCLPALLAHGDCYEWHAGLLRVAYCIVTGAMHAVMCGVSCNDGCGKPTTEPNDDGRSGG